MQYLGGKHRIAKPLSAFLLSRLEGRTFVEPFCGGLNITAAMEPAGPRFALDAHPALISLYREWRRGWRPPTLEITDDLYQALKERNDPTDPMTGFVGFGCSFGGKYFGGLARGAPGRNYALNAFNSLVRAFEKCSTVTFAHQSYENLSPRRDHLVYCDPPYAETTGYSLAFDSARFWERVREWSKAGVEVLVSEYAAPPDFEPVFEIASLVSVTGRRSAIPRIERVFQWCEYR